jgi:HPt (histidine-containing phosphotransfer) domain-containing protein
MGLYDVSDLKEMAQGDTAFVDRMISVFLETTQESLDELLVAFNQKDYKKVSSIAHKIKPSIDLMGINSLKKVVREIESFKEVKAKINENLINEFNDILHQVFGEMKLEFK